MARKNKKTTDLKENLVIKDLMARLESSRRYLPEDQLDAVLVKLQNRYYSLESLLNIAL